MCERCSDLARAYGRSLALSSKAMDSYLWQRGAESGEQNWEAATIYRRDCRAALLRHLSTHNMDAASSRMG
jgi:hypothetical protein